MWFISELCALTKTSESQILLYCIKNNIKTGSAYCNNKSLGIIVSDDDGDKILEDINNPGGDIDNAKS